MKVMKFLKLFLVFGVFVFLFSFAHASSDVIVHIDKTGNALFLGTSDENITAFLPSGVSLVNGKINGNTVLQTSKEGAIWTFYYSLQNSNIEVFLPTGAKVKETNGEVLIDGGNLAIYKEDNLTVSYTIEEIRSGFNSLWLILIALVVFIGIYYFSKKFDLKKKSDKNLVKEEKKKIEVLQEILSERENKIIDILKEKGKIKSSVLRRLVGFPKASFSRHINELEKKGLIKRSGEGRNKFVEVSK